MPNVAAESIPEHRFAKVFADRKLITVVYPHYNRPDVLLRSLEALRRQTGRECPPERLEIIVVDDGSPGDDLADRLPEDVLYLRQRRNHFGASRARNVGAKLANGRYLVFLDPDIMVGPEHLDHVARLFRRHGDRVLLAGRVDGYYYEGSPDPRRQFGVWERPDRPTRRFLQLASGNMAISAALFREAGGFDEDLIYGELEDVVFGWRAGSLPDVTILFSTDMAARHEPHPPGPAHADGKRTLEIIRRKWPEFHHEYVALRRR